MNENLIHMFVHKSLLFFLPNTMENESTNKKKLAEEKLKKIAEALIVECGIENVHEAAKEVVCFCESRIKEEHVKRKLLTKYPKAENFINMFKVIKYVEWSRDNFNAVNIEIEITPNVSYTIFRGHHDVDGENICDCKLVFGSIDEDILHDEAEPEIIEELLKFLGVYNITLKEAVYILGDVYEYDKCIKHAISSMLDWESEKWDNYAQRPHAKSAKSVSPSESPLLKKQKLTNSQDSLVEKNAKSLPASSELPYETKSRKESLVEDIEVSESCEEDIDV